jgi:Kef-type K+ transport system membrane component KefB
MTDTHEIVRLLLVLAAVLFVTRIMAVFAVKLGQPAILGELLGGVLLGSSMLGILDPNELAIKTLAQLGLLILLFEIGLETDLRALTRVGAIAAVVAIVGVVLSFVLGYSAMIAMGVSRLAAVVCAAALTATSIGVSTRVLSELGFLQTEEGRIVLGAAVLDDIIGLVLLSVVGSLVSGTAISAGGVARTSLIAFGFVAVAIVVGSFVVPPLFKALHRLRSPTTIAVMGLSFAFFIAALAGMMGSAIIVGGFVAGVLLNRIDQSDEVMRSAAAMGSLLTPIFFASVGASVDLRALATPRVLLITVLLLLAGALGKILSAYFPWWFKGNKRLIGVAMLPRGEVELIVAQTGLAIGALDASLFGAVTLMVFASPHSSRPQSGARPSRPACR